MQPRKVCNEYNAINVLINKQQETVYLPYTVKSWTELPNIHWYLPELFSPAIKDKCKNAKKKQSDK